MSLSEKLREKCKKNRISKYELRDDGEKFIKLIFYFHSNCESVSCIDKENIKYLTIEIYGYNNRPININTMISNTPWKEKIILDIINKSIFEIRFGLFRKSFNNYNRNLFISNSIYVIKHDVYIYNYNIIKDNNGSIIILHDNEYYYFVIEKVCHKDIKFAYNYNLTLINCSFFDS